MLKKELLIKFRLKMIKSIVLRIYPNKTQQKRLEKWSDSCRFVYNCALEQRLYYWQKYKEQVGMHINKYSQSRDLTQALKLPEFKNVRDVPDNALRDSSISRLEKSFKAFFKFKE